ncbi:MAG: hypothetical protein ACWA40_01880 [Planktomarina sp.]
MSFNILIIAQDGRLQYEAIVFLASLRAQSPNFDGDVYVAVPQKNDRWDYDPNVTDKAVIGLIETLGGKIVSFENERFGSGYPYGNKIEALKVLPEDKPFVFFDTDTLITGELMDVPFDFNKPSASKRVEGTWPKIELYGPGYSEIWGSLYRKFGLDFESSLDKSQPDEFWKRYLYFNAGFFYFRSAKHFGGNFLKAASRIQDSPPKELVCQEMKPWLDQIALPLVIHAMGGGRDALPDGYLDGKTTCHYRMLPLLYARESDHVVEVLEECLAPNPIKKVIKAYDPIKRMVYQGRGRKVRALFDQNNLPKKEQKIRNTIKREGFWMR